MCCVLTKTNNFIFITRVLFEKRQTTVAVVQLVKVMQEIVQYKYIIT